MKRILIGNSLKDDSKAALELGLNFAEKLKNKVTILHSDKLADFDTLDTVFAHMNLEIHQHYIENIIAANEEKLKEQIQGINVDFSEFEYFSRSGAADDVIIKESRADDVDLIVLGHNQKKSWAQKFLGGVTESILHRSDKSVLVVKNEKAINPKKILLAYDFSYHCDEALKRADMLKEAFGAEVHIVNILPCYYEGYYLTHQMQNNFNDLMEKIITEGVDKVNIRLQSVREQFSSTDRIVTHTLLDKDGSTSDKLTEYVSKNKIDLLISGSHKRGKIGEILLGSVALKLLKKADCSVLIAK